jgi:hypothetical protein
MAQGDGRIDAEASKGRDERGDECRAEEQAVGGAEGGRIGRRHFEEKRGQQSTDGESADHASHDTQDGSELVLLSQVSRVKTVPASAGRYQACGVARRSLEGFEAEPR